MQKCNNRVGIVMLLYNRADVAIACLRSLVQSKTDVEWELYLLDNASQLSESELVKAEFDKLASKSGLKGQFIRSEVNHGFPKGNNFGIRHFMERSDITHLCLLNSDVVVTNFWLDRLLEKNADAIGPVTNACGNEQTIPIPIGLSPTDDVFATVNQWAEARYSTYHDYCKETDFLGFYCFLARIELFLKVGLLDERFGQGAYEDDDYCIRILAGGYRMVVARDVFIYHWGTASFSKIPIKKLSKLLKLNRKKLEEKYGLPWKDRSLLPVRGVFDDLEFIAGKTNESNHEMAKLFALRSMGYLGNIINEKCRQPTGILDNIHDIIDRLTKWWSTKRVGNAMELFRLLVSKRPILVLGRFYPADTDMKDGYFQRVRLIDENLEDHCRIYIRYEGAESLTGLMPIILKKKSRVYEFIVRKNNVLHCAFAAVLALICGRIYVHSVLRFDDAISRLLFQLSRKRIFDIHGVVPEEFKYDGDEANSQKFGDLEHWAIDRASMIVVVTHAMSDHLKNKYGANLDSRFVCLSFLSRTGQWSDDNSNEQLRDGVIYCGGLHKWQQVDKMLEYVRSNAARCRFTFLVTYPDEIKRIYKERYGDEFPGVVTSALPHEVAGWYKSHAYGLVLREDIVVNKVACPTKLVEYLQYGLVPIVDCAEIGDFSRYGYRFVQMDSPLPDDNSREEMMRANYAVLQGLYYQFICGLDRMRVL